MCRKIAFFGLRAEILLARSQGLLDSRAGPFLGSVKKYWFFGEIFTSACVCDFFANGSIDAPQMTFLLIGHSVHPVSNLFADRSFGVPSERHFC